MMVYRICGLNLESDLPFPELMPATEEGIHCVFELLPARQRFPDLTGIFLQKHAPDGATYFSCAKRDAGYLLRFHDLADFLITLDGKQISCYPVPGLPEDAIRHLLLGQVVPLVLNLRGTEALHASAVANSNRACAFVGRAGWGKSTLAGSFVKSGCRLLCDDCLALEDEGGRILGIPGYASLHLQADSLAALYGDADSSVTAVPNSGKWSAAAGASTLVHPVNLERIYVLSPPVRGEDAIKFEVLSPSDSLRELVSHAFRLDITDRVMLARQFQFLAEVSARVPAVRLTYPRNHALLAAVQGAIVQDFLGGTVRVKKP